MNTRSLLFLAIPLFLTFNLLGQKSGKNDIDLGILTQGEFYIFDGTRQFYLFGDYRRSYRNFFAQCRVTYTSKSYGGRIGEYLGIDTNSVTYLWLEAGREDNFQFKDRIFIHPKSGLKSLGNQQINIIGIGFNLGLGYYFKLGRQKRFQIEPSVGLTSYYFRQDVFWLELPLQFGDNVQNQNIPDLQTNFFNTTRGVVWGPEIDISFRYYLKKRYSFGLNAIGGVNKYFNTFYMGAFVGFNF